MTNTLDYYDQNSQSFSEDTFSLDLSDLYRRFLTYVPNGGRILDAGCGSGRDSLKFHEMGYQVDAFDASVAMVDEARKRTGLQVQLKGFFDLDAFDQYHGIWACASLLHVEASRQAEVLALLLRALKPGGVLYLSYKHGDSERVKDGRYFCDANESILQSWLSDLKEFARLIHWQTEDRRPHRSEFWLNGLVFRRRGSHLISGGRDHPLSHQLRLCLDWASDIHWAVSFVKETGLRHILPDLHLAILRGCSLRFLTSDYLCVTDPQALRLLLLLQEQGADVRIFQTSLQDNDLEAGFHLKAYLFARQNPESAKEARAFVGSSNLSLQALTRGLEWNLRIDYPEDDGWVEIENQFERLFTHPATVPLTLSWIQEYENRRSPSPILLFPGMSEKEASPVPHFIQAEALQALKNSRDQGFMRGLVVLATGLGKTLLAAFDARQMQAQRILFVAHREEILSQAAAAFLRIFPERTAGFYKGNSRPVSADLLFASIQTLGKNSHLKTFAKNHFDYIVVDEFHHASAPTYRNLLNHFEPAFLIGLTATPERTDQSDILSLCDDNLVYSYNLFSGISAGLLCPFSYFGIWDETVDYKEIPWRNRQFDPNELSNKLATLARARHVHKEWDAKANNRTLGFCVSIRHADFMAQQFNRLGVLAVSVHGESQVGRSEALAGLQSGKFQVVFSVDLFNEGVDLPEIDTILLLKPTQSKILFLQQIGRGLRKQSGKERLTILDYIGNHNSFLQNPLLSSFADYSSRPILSRDASKIPGLPAGCFINLDLQTIDFLRSLESETLDEQYLKLKATLNRRPTLTEVFHSNQLPAFTQKHGGWFSFLKQAMDLNQEEEETLSLTADFLIEVEHTPMTKSYKMVLLEALIELNGFSEPTDLETLCLKSWQVLRRRTPLLADLDGKEQYFNQNPKAWIQYWRKNPIAAWTGGLAKRSNVFWFEVIDKRFVFKKTLPNSLLGIFVIMLQELIDYKLARYQSRLSKTIPKFQPLPQPKPRMVDIPLFPELKIACGHFRTSQAKSDNFHPLNESELSFVLDPSIHFLAHARGNSMNGGLTPVCDGDRLLFEHIPADKAAYVPHSVMALERRNPNGELEYLLRLAIVTDDAKILLRAFNPEYADIEASSDIRPVAILRKWWPA